MQAGLQSLSKYIAKIFQRRTLARDSDVNGHVSRRGQHEKDFPTTTTGNAEEFG
jgi:ribosomal 50S subunit-recycling heat shock protein